MKSKSILCTIYSLIFNR